MKTTEASSQKSVVAELNFGKMTAKRVAWESWEFTIVGPHQVKVTNASYGYLKDEHSYVVGVEVRNGQAVPAECDCPADLYHEKYDCKHKVALAAIGGPTVMQAAIDFERPPSESDPQTPTVTAAEKLTADGGRVPAEEDACECSDLSDLPCFACYMNEEK